MPNVVYESMTRIRGPKWTVRVWREEPRVTLGPDPEVVQVVETAMIQYADAKSIVAVAVRLLPRLNAIEILNNEGDGGLVYPDWP
jgi:hypothetical protein